MALRLHFHLGPVQSFIAEARRTRDIWAGSFLLSWLTAHALSAAVGTKTTSQLSRLAMNPNVLDDPTFNAVHQRKLNRASVVSESWTGSPFLGSLSNHFSVDVDDYDAGTRAADAVRTSWFNLGQAVETL